ncbi:MAG: DUF697 domain-containing protein [Alcaligenaceae bacterium]
MFGKTIDVVAVEVADPRADRLDAANKLIASARNWSFAAALVPVPYLDLALLASLQTKLIVNLASLYDQKLFKQAVTSLITLLIGTLAPAGASRLTSSVLIKFLPGMGSAIGAVSLATFGASATCAIGKVFVKHFENGGSISTFSAKDVQEDLKKEFASASKI